MTKEFYPETSVGDISEDEDFRRVGGSLSGATGESVRSGNSVRDKISDVAQTTQTLFSDHSEKLFTIVALIGFILVFYSENIKNWSDFWRYVAFLGIIVIFYILLQIISYVKKKDILIKIIGIK